MAVWLSDHHQRISFDYPYSQLTQIYSSHQVYLSVLDQTNLLTMVIQHQDSHFFLLQVVDYFLHCCYPFVFILQFRITNHYCLHWDQNSLNDLPSIHLQPALHMMNLIYLNPISQLFYFKGFSSKAVLWSYLLHLIFLIVIYLLSYLQ